MKRFLPLMVLLVCILTFSARIWESRNDSLRNDEAAWIFSTVYLKHYSALDWKNKDWQALDAYDHPPFAKYYYGLSLLSTTGAWKTIDDKTFWQKEGAGFANESDFQRQLTLKIPYEALFMSRVVEAFSAILAASGVIALGTILFGPIAGAASLTVFMMTEIVGHFVPIVESDFLQLALLLFSLCFLVQWMKMKERKTAVLAGIFLGLAFATKISAVVQLPAVFLAGAFAIFSSDKKKKLFTDFALMIAAIIFVSLVLNPTMLFSPIETLQTMFSHRAMQVEATSFFAGLDLVSPVATTIAALQQIFVFMGLSVDKIFPLGLLLFSAGLVSIFTKIYSVDKKFRPEVVVFVVCALSWVFASLGGFATSLRIRYLLPAMPFIAIFAGCGVTAIAKGVSALPKLIRSRQFYLTLGVFVSLAFMLSTGDINEYIQGVNLSPKIQKRRYEAIVKRNPELVSAKSPLVAISIAENDYPSAISAAREASDISGLAGDVRQKRYYDALALVLTEQVANRR